MQKLFTIPSEWQQVGVGDVLKWPNGTMRVVRLFHPSVYPRKAWCFFTIMHGSWTERCYTLYSIGELIGMGVQPTGVKVKFKHPLDLKVNACIEKGCRSMTWRRVRGIR